MATEATEEQVIYANILNKGMIVGLIGLVVSFTVYALGILEPIIPIDQVQNYWNLPGGVAEYLEKTGIHTGWAWAGNLNHGDMLNFLPIAFLSFLTIICYLAILPGLIRKKDTAYIIFAIIEVIVLAGASSGLLNAGGH
ncbi:MAG: hypothetical protein Q7U10_01280 [Thermodesulfovibrionia bacterium]|nr:hypothetical protein [Thermodesulfovibrionia bacterium]